MLALEKSGVGVGEQGPLAGSYIRPEDRSPGEWHGNMTLSNPLQASVRNWANDLE